MQFDISEKKISFSDDDTYIYNGGDFTQSRLRGRGLNKTLMCAALEALHAETERHMVKHASKAINMIYGITEEVMEPLNPDLLKIAHVPLLRCLFHLLSELLVVVMRDQ